MHFEWDSEKARTNRHNHDGVAFAGAAYVFGDRDRLVELGARSGYGEERWVTTGSALGRMFVVVYTSMRRTARLFGSSLHGRLTVAKKPSPTVRTAVDVTQPPPNDAMDWQAFDAITDDQVRASAENDPDNPLLTEEELSRMRRAPDVRGIRQSMGLSQAKFADRFNLSLATLQEWEQGRRQMNRSVQNLMLVIEHEPAAVDRALGKAGGPPR